MVTATSPKTQDIDFENNETQVQGAEEYSQVNRDASPHMMVLRVNCNSDSCSKVASSCKDLEQAVSANRIHSGFNTMLNS